MKAKEIRELSDEELQDKLKELKEELFNCAFSWPPGSWKTMRIKEVRRGIARVKTILRERALS